MIFAIAELARLAWAQLWQVTVAIGVIVLLVRLIGRKRPHLAYGLWMLVVVKCLTPPILSSPTGIFCWVQPRAFSTRMALPQAADRPLSEEREISRRIVPSRRLGAIPSAGPRMPLSRRLGPNWRLVDRLLAVWIGGMTVCAGVVASMHIACFWMLKRSGHATDEDLSATVSALALRLGVRRGVRVLVTTKQFGPAVFGVIRPTLVLPGSLLAELASDQIEPILAHELIHIRRGDIAAGFAQTLEQIVWWFHPLVWWANRAAGRERERCCDLESLASLGCEPGAYARALLRVLELRQQLRPLFALPGIRPLDLTRNRLEHIMACGSAPHPRTSRGQWLSLAAIAIVLVPGASLPLPPARSAVDDGATPPVHGLPLAKPATTSKGRMETDRSPKDWREVGNTQTGDSSMVDDVEKLQGTWRMLTLEMDGAPMPGGVVTGARIVVEGNTFTTSGMGATYKGTLTIDATRTPRTLDMAFSEGPERGNTSLAIYEVDGGSWKICLGLTGTERPKGFSTTPGSGHALETLEREGSAEPRAPVGEKNGLSPSETLKRDANAEPVQSDTKELDRLAGEWSGVSLVLSGQAVPEALVKGSTRVAKDNETTVTVGGQVVVKATFTVDSSQSPRTIDYTLTGGPNKGKIQLGIYEFDGEMVKFCFSSPGKDRPQEFESKPGDGRTFSVWKKAKR